MIKPEPQSGPLTVDLTCRRGWSLTGSVAGPDGEPLPGVMVTGLYTQSVHRKTDDEGRFRVEGIVPGQEHRARLPDRSYLFAFQLQSGESRDLGTKQLRR